MDLKDALMELLGKTEEEIISIRPGEKLHETLINTDELRYTWEYDNKYIIFSPFKEVNEIKANYPNIKKLEMSDTYSSNIVEKIPKNELITIIEDSGMLNIQK